MDIPSSETMNQGYSRPRQLSEACKAVKPLSRRVMQLRNHAVKPIMGVMDVIEPIGQRIRRERLKRSMTQRDLAEQVGVGAPHISKIEAGRESPSDELLRSVAEVLDCNFDELLLAARRMPPDLMDRLASDPKGSLEYLRQWKARES